VFFRKRPFRKESPFEEPDSPILVVSSRGNAWFQKTDSFRHQTEKGVFFVKQAFGLDQTQKSRVTHHFTWAVFGPFWSPFWLQNLQKAEHFFNTIIDHVLYRFVVDFGPHFGRFLVPKPEASKFAKTFKNHDTVIKIKGSGLQKTSNN